MFITQFFGQYNTKSVIFFYFNELFESINPVKSHGDDNNSTINNNNYYQYLSVPDSNMFWQIMTYRTKVIQ